MKKSTLFLACCIGLMLFASCKKDPIAPTIDIFEDVGCVTENAQVYSGDEIVVGFTGTGENLTQIEIVLSQDGTVLARHTESFEGQKDDPVTPFYYEASFVLEATGTINIKGTVTDANGLIASKSFNIFANEKPNAKFVGRYEGNALISGTVSANINGMAPIEQPFENREMPAVLLLEAGDEINEVVGTCTFEDRTIDCKGTVEGNTVTFEALNDVVTFNYDLGGGMSVSPQINMTYTIKGTLNDGVLMLDGNCAGNGDIAIFFYSGTLDLSATIGGSLIKE